MQSGSPSQRSYRLKKEVSLSHTAITSAIKGGTSYMKIRVKYLTTSAKFSSIATPSLRTPSVVSYSAVVMIYVTKTDKRNLQ